MTTPNPDLPRPASALAGAGSVRLRVAHALVAGTLLLLVQACSMLEGERAPAPVEPRPPGGSQPQRPSEPARPDTGTTRPDSSTSRPGPGSGPALIPGGNITIKGSCSQVEEDGYREQATLQVENNQVKSLAWQLWVGRKGSCKFDLSEFVQTKLRPSIELTARNGSGCKLVIYQDPRRITVGFADCQKHCTGPVYEQAYPVMFDPRSGSCADLSR